MSSHEVDVQKLVGIDSANTVEFCWHI